MASVVRGASPPRCFAIFVAVKFLCLDAMLDFVRFQVLEQVGNPVTNNIAGKANVHRPAPFMAPPNEDVWSDAQDPRCLRCIFALFF